jgi:hypothetical protein
VCARSLLFGDAIAVREIISQKKFDTSNRIMVERRFGRDSIVTKMDS